MWWVAWTACFTEVDIIAAHKPSGQANPKANSHPVEATFASAQFTFPSHLSFVHCCCSPTSSETLGTCLSPFFSSVDAVSGSSRHREQIPRILTAPPSTELAVQLSRHGSPASRYPIFR
jgi:hypothetical protein